jgi:hypothetical protein
MGFHDDARCAPSTPPVKVPSRVVGRPPASSIVFSPKYQTLPSLSWANQSSVSSVSSPSVLTVSWTSMQVTPRITLVLWVTKNSSCSRPCDV